MGRKASFTQGSSTNAPFSLTSPTSVRPGGRHRELSTSFSPADAAVASPVGAGRNIIDDGGSMQTPPPPPLLLRRRTDHANNQVASGQADREKEAGSRVAGTAEPSAPVPSFRRSVTIGAGGAAIPPTSPWASGGAAFSPMGSFGSFDPAESSAQPSTPVEKKGAGFGGSRATSRWSKFMSKNYAEDGTLTEKLSVGNLGKLSEADVEPSSQDWIEARANRPLSNDTDPFGGVDREGVDGGAATTSSQSAQRPQPPPPPPPPPQQQQRQTPRYGTPTASITADNYRDVGSSSVISGFRDVTPDHGRQRFAGPPRQTAAGEGEPLSPTETNPYQSPVPEKAETEGVDTDDAEMQRQLHYHHLQQQQQQQHQHHPAPHGLPNQGVTGRMPVAPGTLPMSFDGMLSDSSQSFGAAAFKPFSGLTGIGGATGPSASSSWSANGSGLMGGPDGDHGRFGAEMGLSGFGALSGDVQPTSSSAAASIGLLSTGGFGDSEAVSRGGRPVSLFPPAMQAQMQAGDPAAHRHQLDVTDAGVLSPSTAGIDPSTRSTYDMHRSLYASAAAVRGGDAASSVMSSAATIMPKGSLEDLSLSRRNDGVRDPPFTERAVDPAARASVSAQLADSLQGAATPLSSTMATAATGANALQTSQASTQPGTHSVQSATTSAAQTPQIPQNQQRTMVMPDRMRWIYKDPQGNTQGTWTGLEMHDWFKAGFFSAELLVKKHEDPEFEPLGQLIRRIGNSREPFLVPQIGIPHGPPPGNQGGSPWSPGNAVAAGGSQTSPSGAVQPPFAGAFPSFGTTLTAEQQNALERRKQEEQYLMARQKEYLAQQQALHKQMQQMHGVHPQQLHHHSSAHSLHSQPSYGSITSPNAFHPTPPQGPIQHPQPVPSLFDAQLRHGGPPYLGSTGVLGAAPDLGSSSLSNSLREEELAALLARQNLNRDGHSQQQQLPQQQGFGGSSFHSQHLQQQQQQQQHQHPQDNQGHAANVAVALAHRAQLQREQAKHDAMLVSSSDEQQARNDRFEEYNQLRAQLGEEQSPYGAMLTDAETALGSLRGPSEAASTMSHRPQQFPYLGAGQSELQPDARQDAMTPTASASSAGAATVTATATAMAPASHSSAQALAQQQEPEILSLSQQVRKAAFEMREPTVSASDGPAPGLPHPFPPPPPSISPLPAPAAQRSRQQLPDALTIQEESRVRSQTSSVETPGAAASIAPWAKEATEGPKGPSLKEIQEVEARKAARAEEAAAVARRALLEQERERLSQHTGSNSASPTGLPPTSTWGSGASPATPTSASGASAWSKAPGVRSALGPAEGTTKKTLSQIQKEEEARKQKAAVASAADSASSIGGSGPAGTVSTGKRYADLASKVAASSAVASGGSVGGAWTTVGATGKVKAAGPVAPAPPTAVRAASVNAAAGAKARPVVPSSRGSTTPVASTAPPSANEEFFRWARAALAKGLNSSINGEYSPWSVSTKDDALLTRGVGCSSG